MLDIRSRLTVIWRQMGGACGLPLLLLLLSVGTWGLLWGKEVRSGAFLIGDCPYYASATVSLLVDGDLDLRNQLRGGLATHQRQVALGLSGEWYPKHPILLSILSVPFYAAFGIGGFLLFNLLVLAALAIVLWLLCRRHVSPGLSTATTLLTLAGTFLWAYAYNYSPDLLATLLVLSGLLLLLERRGPAGGFLLGLAVAAKTIHLFTLALVGLLLLLRRPRREALWCAFGLPPILALALLNLQMFGSPATSGYDRTLVLEDGNPVMVSHRGFFDLNLWEGMRGQLLDPRVGLIPTSPLLLLALPGLWLLFRRRPWEALLFVAVSEFLFLLFSTYRWWATSHYGNRFLMVPVCLAVVPLALSLNWLWHGWGRRLISHRLSTVGLRGT